MIEEKRDSFRNIKYKLALLVTILGLFALVSGTSYAVLKGETSSENEQVIKSGNVELLLTENYDNMSATMIPLSDEEGLLQEETYKFNIKNIGVASAKYDLKLENEVPSDYEEKVLEEKYIKIGLEINGEEHGPFNLNEVNKIIDSNIIYENEIINYELRIWLDEDKEEELLKMEEYKAFLKLSLEAEQSGEKVKGPNAPVLSENMIPVYYDESEDTWKKADKSNSLEEYKWYDYDKKMWANSVTVDEEARAEYLSAKAGTAIDMDDILTMQVWIPRYKYTVWNYNLDGTVGSEPQEINIEWESGTVSSGEIECEDSISGTAGNTSETCVIKETSEECTDEACNGLTYTHPGFTFGEDELYGIWVGKFENSHDGGENACTPVTHEAPNTGCNVTTMNVKVVPNVTSWRGMQLGTSHTNIMKMNDSNNMYGFIENQDDTHMMKNSEWGAVAYLSHSKYGKNSEIEMNTNSGYITGCGPTTAGSITATTECSTYEAELGQGASTTGNIYGIYDMSGGALEQMMSNIVSPSGAFMSGRDNQTTGTTLYQNSGFDGVLYDNEKYTTYNGLYDTPQEPYYEKYSFGTTYNDSVARKRSKLGDATKEVYNTGTNGWYNDRSNLAYSSGPWFCRGGRYDNEAIAGLFSSINDYGVAIVYNASRLVISQP